MSDQCGTNVPSVNTSSSMSPGDIPPNFTQAFRFSDLPGEVRNKIYRQCLINEGPIPLEILELFVSEAKPREEAGSPKSEPLIWFSLDMEIEKWTIITSLLRVSKAVHHEAASIFYGCNKFQFLRQQSLIHFLYFDWNHLPDVGHQHLRYLQVGFPPIERRLLDDDIVSQFSEIGDRGLQIIAGLPALEDVTFRLREDVMTSDIGLLRRIRHSCRGCRVALCLGDVEVYDERRPYSRRVVKISSEALEEMREWGWEVKGRYMEVDRNHAWKDEQQWFEALQESTRWGLEHGLIHEPKFWPKTSWFRLAGLSI